ncbi:hypothetical protein G7068_15960 [Leucobacter viscericola]|uniref:Uncharacterized protein n=1 Tax=Leucobacter viscericola TaxID=2714935 RepID=A0A6G7XJJ5_9MICO|nr:hypothetical protein [Leucobacter viscericola]QIK64541.1 hypothetical protein G7068_15960 [Leucobacter viscericola]
MNAKSDKNQSRTVHGMFARVNGVVAAFALIGAVGLTVTLSAASLPEVDPVKVEAVEIAETPEAPQIDVPEVDQAEAEQVAAPALPVPAVVTEAESTEVNDTSGLPSEGTLSLPPCATEDAANCYWNASVAGNGLGRSFIDVGGVTYYAEN